jgi:hypothetical protein
MPLLALSFYLFHDHYRLVIVFTLHLRTVNAIVHLFILICALAALANVNNFLSIPAFALVHEFELENAGNGFLHLVFLYNHNCFLVFL